MMAVVISGAAGRAGRPLDPDFLDLQTVEHPIRTFAPIEVRDPQAKLLGLLLRPPYCFDAGRKLLETHAAANAVTADFETCLA
jgi:hypothetical protein